MPDERGGQVADRRTPGPLIGRQIGALTRDHAFVQLQDERNWASITFSGIRYCFTIEWPDTAALQELAQILPEHEFSIPGYFVADILIRDRSESRLRVEILTIVDPLKRS